MFKNNAAAAMWLVMLLAILNILDFLTTHLALSTGGAEEANVLMLSLIEYTGTIWALLWIKLLIVIVIFPFVIITNYRPEWIVQYSRPGFSTFLVYLLIPVNAFYAYIVVHNVYVIYQLSQWQYNLTIL
jgi:hypothetical protein